MILVQYILMTTSITLYVGAIYDATQSYFGAFIGAGIPPIISAIVMTAANRMK